MGRLTRWSTTWPRRCLLSSVESWKHSSAANFMRDYMLELICGSQCLCLELTILNSGCTLRLVGKHRQVQQEFVFVYLHLYSCICACSSSSFSQCLYLVLTIVLSGPAPGGKHKSPGSERARIFKQQFLRSRISRSGSSSRDSSVPRVLLTQILSKSSHGTCSLGMPKKIPPSHDPSLFLLEFPVSSVQIGFWNVDGRESGLIHPFLLPPCL